jgi:hypothetical protein
LLSIPIGKKDNIWLGCQKLIIIAICTPPRWQT